MRHAGMGKGQNNGIQMLRGIACIFVVLCHTKLTNIGSWGVDIFFVISGFMLMYSTRSGSKHFFLKRVKRIIPLYWFMTIVTSVLICVAPSLFNSYEFTWEYLLKSLLFIPYRHSEIVQPVYGLGWTLNYEMFIYIIFGMSMNFSYKYRAVITIIACTAFTIAGGELQECFIKYYGGGVLMEFAAGIVLYYVIDRHIGRINLYLGTGMVIVSFLLFIIAGDKSIYLNLMFASMAFIGAWKIGETLSVNNIVVKSMVSIGNASYCIYLTHVYAVRLVERMLGMMPILVQAFAAVFCGCVVGMVIYNGEIKLRSFKNKPLRSKLQGINP